MKDFKMNTTLDLEQDQKTIIELLAAMLDGEPVPKMGSPKFEKFMRASRHISNAPESSDLCGVIGLKALGLMLDRYRASVIAERELALMRSKLN